MSENYIYAACAAEATSTAEMLYLTFDMNATSQNNLNAAIVEKDFHRNGICDTTQLIVIFFQDFE